MPFLQRLRLLERNRDLPTMTKKALRDLQNAVLDLQSADFNTYERPLAKIAQALAADELSDVVTHLKSRADFEAFLASANQGGSMMGTARLNWPNDSEEELGLTIHMLERAGSDPRWFRDLAHRYYYSGSKIIAGVRKITTAVILPFLRDFTDYVIARGDVSAPSAPVDRDRIVSVGGDEGDGRVESASWTGVVSPAARLDQTKALLPLAQQGLETLIAHYQTGGHNGGPPLGDHAEAVMALRVLHAALGAIVGAIDAGEFGDERGEGLFAEASRCASRVVAALKDDPVPLVGATMISAVLTVLGCGEVGGVLGGAVMLGKKR